MSRQRCFAVRRSDPTITSFLGARVTHSSLSSLPQADSILPPDAAARDAAKREEAGIEEAVLRAEDFHFITRNVSDEEKAAVIAVLTEVRTEETAQVRRVERRERQPWARSQRVPQAFSDLLID